MAPALAVADALRADGAEVVFVGGTRAEAQLVPAAGYELHTISVEGMSRTNPLRAVRAIVRAALAVPRARALLKQLDPDAVLGGGGYVAGPVGLAALSLRVPLVLTEADSHLGLDQPPARARRAARVPGVSDPRPRRRPLPRDGPADSRAGRRPHGCARAVGGRRGGDVCARVRRLARRALDQFRRC